jgi:hypothetical protein
MLFFSRYRDARHATNIAQTAANKAMSSPSSSSVAAREGVVERSSTITLPLWADGWDDALT